MGAVAIAVITALATVVTAAVTWLIAKRRTSGNVATSSDASLLWAESQTLRKELRDEVRDLRATIAKREERIVQLELRITALEIKLEESG